MSEIRREDMNITYMVQSMGQGAGSMGHGAWGMEHGAWSMEQGAESRRY